jgi:hypothetical protein
MTPFKDQAFKTMVMGDCRISARIVKEKAPLFSEAFSLVEQRGLAVFGDILLQLYACLILHGERSFIEPDSETNETVQKEGSIW